MNAYIAAGFQLVGEWANSVRSYKVGPPLLSLTTTRTEVGVQFAWNRYTFDGSRMTTAPYRSLVSGSTELALSPRIAFQAMALSGAPPTPRYCTLIEYLADDAIVPSRSRIEKTRPLPGEPPRP